MTVRTTTPIAPSVNELLPTINNMPIVPINGVTLRTSNYNEQTDAKTAIESLGLKFVENVGKEIEVYRVERKQEHDAITGKLISDYYIINCEDSITRIKIPMFISLEQYESMKINEVLPEGKYSGKFFRVSGVNAVKNVTGYYVKKTNEVGKHWKTGFILSEVLTETNGRDSLKLRDMQMNSKQRILDIEEFYGEPFDRTNTDHYKMFIDLK